MIAQIASMGYIQARRNLPATNIQNKAKKVAKSSVPYFERNCFLDEEGTVQELSSMHDLGFVKMTMDDLIETKTALNVIGYNPAIKLTNLLIENDVLGISRPGVDNHPHLNFITSLLARFRREAGTTHLALSLPKSLQKLLDVFSATGEILPSLSPVNLADYGLKSECDYLALLKAARLAGYKLVAVEPDTPVTAFDPMRERLMAANIQMIFKNEVKAKVIFLAADKHLSYSSIGDWIPVAGILQKNGINICTVNQYWHNDFMPKVFACLLQGLTRPVALASKDVKMFSGFQSKSLQLEHVLPNNWDMTIIYPKTAGGTHRLIKQSLTEMSVVISQAFSFIRQKYGKSRRNQETTSEMGGQKELY